MTSDYWWRDDPTENLWLEVTDRADLGSNLHAPQRNQSGVEFWSYSFIKLVKPGDVIFHYHKPAESIVAFSIVSSTYSEKEIIWGARGTYARAAGVQPHLRPGWAASISQYQLLEQPLTIHEIRSEIKALKDAYRLLEDEHDGRPTYRPFEMGNKRPTRPMQGYLFKFPRFMVDLFEQLQNEYTILDDYAINFEDDDYPIDEESDRKGWVYIIHNPAWKGWVKIGCTVHPKNRLRSYWTGSPHRDYQPHCWKMCELAWKSEQEVHEWLRDILPEGAHDHEWFRIPPEHAEECLKLVLGEGGFRYKTPIM